MKTVIQRVKYSSVTIDNKLCSKIENGLLVLFCAEKNDLEEYIEFLANKILNLRIFEDNQNKMNLSVMDIKGEILVVSQFTLAANCKKGLRPSFDNAMEPKSAEIFYEKFVERLKQSNLNIKTGIFGADMKVELLNDGPVTFILEKKSE